MVRIARCRWPRSRPYRAGLAARAVRGLDTRPAISRARSHAGAAAAHMPSCSTAAQDYTRPQLACVQKAARKLTQAPWRFAREAGQTRGAHTQPAVRGRLLEAWPRRQSQQSMWQRQPRSRTWGTADNPLGVTGSTASDIYLYAFEGDSLILITLHRTTQSKQNKCSMYAANPRERGSGCCRNASTTSIRSL